MTFISNIKKVILKINKIAFSYLQEESTLK